MNRARLLPGCNLALVALALFTGAPARAAPANTLQEMKQTIGRCLIDRSGAPGEEVTVRFSLRRDGALLGKPRITYSKLPDDPVEQSRFLKHLADAFGRCFPAEITDTLGGAIAGKILTFRLALTARQTPI